MRKREDGLVILLGWVILLSILYSTLSILRHHHFQSGGFDLGIYDQAVWQYSRFVYPYNTIKERFILGDHLTLTLPLLAPLYWLWSDARMLLIFQAFWLSFSTLAIYKLALLRLSPLFTNYKRPRLVGEWVAVAVAMLYSVFPGIQYAVFSDFHPVAIGVGLLPWVAYFLETKRKKLLIASVILLLLTQENMGIALGGLGIIYIVWTHNYHTTVCGSYTRRMGFIFVIVGLFYSLLAVKVVAQFSPVGFGYWPQVSPDPVLLLKSFFDAPEKQQVWLYALTWFSFLPLLSPGAMLAVALDLSQYFVTGPQFVRMWSPYTHHHVILGLFLAIGTLDGLGFIKTLIDRSKINLSKNAIAQIKKSIFPVVPMVIPIMLLISALGQQYIFHFPLNKLAKYDYWKEEPWMRDNRALIDLVPKEASVAAQQNLVPHLSHRKEIYLVYPRLQDFIFTLDSSVIPAKAGIQNWIPDRVGNDKQSISPHNILSPCGQKSCWWLDFAGKPQYLIVDLRPNQWLTQILETNEHFDEAVANMEKAGRIVLDRNVNNARIYRIEY